MTRARERAGENEGAGEGGLVACAAAARWAVVHTASVRQRFRRVAGGTRQRVAWLSIRDEGVRWDERSRSQLVVPLR